MLSPRPILLVEDDAALSATLVEAFEEEGNFKADPAASLGEAKQRLAQDRYDAILLDIGLPDGDGRDFCAELRREGCRTPVIMLTGHTAEMDVVRGLAAGATDYVTKPIRMAELLARLRAQLRAYDNSEDAAFVIGPYQFRPSAKLLLDQSTSRKIRLTDKEVAILKYLRRAQGRPVRPETLMTEIWGYHATAVSHTLQTHVYRLRRKIEPREGQFCLLLSDPSGYRLNLAPAPTAVASPAVSSASGRNGIRTGQDAR